MEHIDFAYHKRNYDKANSLLSNVQQQKINVLLRRGENDAINRMINQT